MQHLAFLNFCLIRFTVNVFLISLFALSIVLAIVPAKAQTVLDSSLTQTTTAEHNEPTNYNQIALYLPLHADQHKELLIELRTALDAARLTNIKIRTAENWLQYQQAIRGGERGLFFAAPHYAAWAINKMQFRPLLRLYDPIKYVIAVERSKGNFFEINDLANGQICTQQALNLDYLLVNNAFQNRLLSANEKPVWSVLDAMLNPQNNCDAYSISEHVFANIEQEHPNKFIRLQQSRHFNNYVFMAHPTLSSHIRKKISNFLLTEKTLELLTPLYERYAKQSKLVPANTEDYPPSYADILRQYW